VQHELHGAGHRAKFGERVRVHDSHEGRRRD
jgi:hypothetical protein